MGNECLLSMCQKKQRDARNSSFSSPFFSSSASIEQPASGSLSVVSPLRSYYEANVHRMSADVQGIYKAHFTGSLIQRVSRALKPIFREDAQDLSLILQHVPTVDSISFAGNHLDARSLEVMLPALTQLPRLTKLRISQNELMDEGVTALAKVMGKLVALQDLLLDENHFGDRGAKSLADALPLCLVLVHVDISKNVISLDGIHAVIAGAERCPSLKWVKVAFNRFDAASLLQSNFAFELLTK